ncbi:hypothetical protein Nepgr_016277 [Nepenthes gracilis]|uniref:Kinesin motor domain-containing protein n=1 Tax=Nepenthes gracilis TaxID=150966 RepID=A0AAD3SQ75_NEPGR|nr:hypothetical protein Nepgr_016277 [Nepenthes gracilis]
MEPKPEIQDQRSLSALPLKTLQRLAKPTFSNKQQKTNQIRSKSQSISDENTPHPDPNIQLIEPLIPQFNPSKSPSKLSNFHKDLEIATANRREEVSSPPDPSVKAVVRIRPADGNEKGSDQMMKKVSDNVVRIGDRELNFDSVLDWYSKQEDVFRLVGVPLVKDALAGYNASILSYGQTGSGKTYTMWGPPSAMIDSGSASIQKGIVPRIFEMLFSEIQRQKENSDGKQINYQCRCSFLEIYNGQIGDLLNPTQRNLKMMDDAKTGFYIENLTEEYVTSYDDVTQILIKGLSSRKVGATSMNSKSSRSHIVFTCIIESWCKETPSKSFSSSKTSRINLVDLAGVERHRHDDDAEKEFKRQGENVKKSLSQLGYLVNILAKGSQPEDAAYRSSHLTHLLQESLGGNAKLFVICTVSSDNKNCSETFSTLRFGQRIRSVRNNPVINEITEDDVNDISDQIRQLKEELIRAKLYFRKDGTGSEQLKGGRSIRETVNQLRISLNRSLMLPSIDIDNDSGGETANANEDDVKELCQQLNNLRKSCEENPREFSSVDSSNFASAQGSCDTYFTSEHEKNCLHESVEVNSDGKLQITGPSIRSEGVIGPCSQSGFLEDLPLSESPKIRDTQRKSIVNSFALLENQSNVLELSKLNKQSEHIRSSLQSSRSFSGPAESLAASLRRGLEIIDYHQRNSASNKSSASFSFERLTLKPFPAADNTNASVQAALSEGRLNSLDGTPCSFLCISCRAKLNNGSMGNTISKGAGDVAVAQTNDRGKELENFCIGQAAKIEELNHLVEQFKHERECCDISKQSQAVEIKEPVITEETCEIKDMHQEHGRRNASFDTKEKEELLKEIQKLRSQLQAHTDASSPDKPIEKLRSSLLSRSMQLQKSMSSRDNNSEEEVEKERQSWIAMETEWINLTDELRLDLESNRQRAEKAEMELRLEKRSAEELDDALHRAVLGHGRIVEHYVELQEKYNELSEKHRRIMEGVAEVKKAAAKAGAKGQGPRFAKALAAELSAMRVEKERERERLRKENRSLRLQLRDTAEAVHTAGELLVRLREAEEAASVAEANLSSVQQENDGLRKQIEKLKRKHKMEMVTMKQYLAESKLPEAALRPMKHFDDHAGEEDDDGQAWRAEFRTTYQHHHY